MHNTEQHNFVDTLPILNYIYIYTTEKNTFNQCESTLSKKYLRNEKSNRRKISHLFLTKFLTALDVYIHPKTIAANIGYTASYSQNFEKFAP